MKLLPFDHAIRNLARSPRRLFLVVGGSTLVSLLVLGAVAFSRGLEASLGASGLATNALLLGTGSEESVERSEISPTTAEALHASVDGIAVHAGRPAIASEIHVALPASLASPEQATTDTASATRATEESPIMVRGYETASFLVHPQVRLKEGRWPSGGASEVAAGPEALARIDGAKLGSTILLAGEPCVVVGVFEAPGTTMHGEFWMPVELLAIITQRSTRSCVIAALGGMDEAGERIDPQVAFDDVEAFTAMRLDLETTAVRESEYYAQLAAFLAPIRMLVLITALLVAFGGALGGINAMYAAFASRVREAGTLQAIGFSRGAIAISLLIESLVACATGALIACILGRLVLDGLAVRFSMGTFTLAVDSAAIAAGLLAGLLLGVVGGIAPIARCLSLPIPLALRS